VAAIDAGFYQQTIADEAYAREQRITSGEDVVVGVNAYVEPETVHTERFDVPVGIAEQQHALLEGRRSERDGEAVEAALGALRREAEGAQNVMPAILGAVRAEASLGEICGTLRAVFGEYRPASAAQI
jgi:methylmalonyl-CoA mutase N-terminal domain/subunit